jgi:NADPH:quinone reductase-like Zn-dependent oxidoreductase
MKAIHLTAYGNPAQNLMMVEVSEPNAPSASEALVRMAYAKQPAGGTDIAARKAITIQDWGREHEETFNKES